MKGDRGRYWFSGKHHILAWTSFYSSDLHLLFFDFESENFAPSSGMADGTLYMIFQNSRGSKIPPEPLYRGSIKAIIVLLGPEMIGKCRFFRVISDTAYLVETDYQWGNCGLSTGTESCRVFRQPSQTPGPIRFKK